MAALDWVVVAAYLAAMLAIGIALARRANRGLAEYFASGRALPWWLAGTSMLATTFASDTPLYVTGLVRERGLWGNWMWWGFLASHALVVALFVRLWRRSGVLTEVELCELRYDGRGAAFLRGFKAVYWGLLWNMFIVGAFSILGLTKVLEVTTGLSTVHAVLLAGGVTMAYATVAGLWGVVVTDLVQFALAIAGALVLAVIALGEAGGASAVAAHPAVTDKLALFPSAKDDVLWVLSFFLVQWWAWKNTDGGGIWAQRAIASRDERHAAWGGMWFLVGHYVLRAWPWIAVALASLVLLPMAPGGDPEKAYPQMIVTYLPVGLRGLLLASFLAAFMSTVDTHMNWGASYLVNDLWKRFVAPGRSEAHYLWVGRVAGAVILSGAMAIAFFVQRISAAFDIVLNLTAGVGLVLLARWLWWRVNAWAELSAIVASGAAYAAMRFVAWSRLAELAFIAGSSTVAWLAVCLATPPVGRSRLLEFFRRVRPPAWGWARVAREAPDVRAEPLVPVLALWGLAVACVASWMLAVGALAAARWGAAAALGAAGAVALVAWLRLLDRGRRGPEAVEQTAGAVGDGALGRGGRALEAGLALRPRG